MRTEELDLFAPPSAEERRDAGLEKVSREEFILAVRQWVIRNLKDGDRVTGETIRVGCLKDGIVPHHCNAWGAAIRSMSEKILFHTGDYVKMRTSSSHARANPVWVVRL